MNFSGRKRHFTVAKRVYQEFKATIALFMRLPTRLGHSISESHYYTSVKSLLCSRNQYFSTLHGHVFPLLMVAY